MQLRTKNILFALLVIVIFTLIYPILGSNTIGLDFGSDSLTLTGPQKYAYVLAYSDIASLELTELGDAGEAVTGGENRTCRWGGWTNAAWGDYEICAAKKVSACILITQTGGSRLVLSYQDDATTQELYKMFSELLAHYQEA